MKLQLSRKDIYTVPNFISCIRIFLIIPILIFLDKIELGYEYRIYTAIFLILAALTDFLDGFLARKLNQISEFGKIIDPLADKIAIGMVILKLYLLGYLSLGLLLIIVCRDLIILIGGIIVTNKINKILPSNMLGKISVSVIAFFLLGLVLKIDTVKWLYDILLYSCILMSFLSVIGYSIRAYDILKWNKSDLVQK